jgi:hypothetical protein
MRHASGKESCRWDGEEMTVAKPMTNKQKSKAEEHEIPDDANLITGTLSEMTALLSL